MTDPTALTIEEVNHACEVLNTLFETTGLGPRCDLANHALEKLSPNVVHSVKNHDWKPDSSSEHSER